MEQLLDWLRTPPLPGKKPLFYWILESGFISDLQWDPGDWHWQQTHKLGDAPFGYSSKRGYQNARKPHHPPGSSTSSKGWASKTPWPLRLWPRCGTTPACAKSGPSSGWPSTKGSRWARGSKPWGSKLPAKVAIRTSLSLPNTALWNAPPPERLGTLSVAPGLNGRRPTASPSPGLSSLWGKLSSKRRTTPRTSKITTLAATLIGDNRSTSSEAFFFTTFGPKDAAGISTDNTPSRGSYSSPGRPRPRWAWPPGKPSDLLAMIGVRISN